MKGEASLVNSLSSLVSAPLPYYEFVSHDSLPFAGYRKLGGVPCSAGNYRKSWTTSLGRSLGQFLSELHALDTSRVAFDRLEKHSAETWAATFNERHLLVTRLAYPLLNTADRARAERAWSALRLTLSQARFLPSLIHDDLMGSNILVDPRTKKLAGILDWSDAKVGDPAVDFAGLMSIDRRLGELALESYEGNSLGLKERAEIYLRYVPLGEIAWAASQSSKRTMRLGFNDFSRWTAPNR